MPPNTIAMSAPLRPDRGAMLAALLRWIAGAEAPEAQIKAEPTGGLFPVERPIAATVTAPFPGMGVIDIIKPETKPAKAPPATQYHSIVATTVQSSLFFKKLPHSVRVVIFRLTMISHLPVKIQRRPFAAEPNLLFTCKQVRKEAQSMFWTDTTFQCRDAVYVCTSKTRAPQLLYQRQLSVLLEWLDRIGKEKAHLIKSLQIDYDEDCQFNGHPEYQSNWPATAEEVMKSKKRGLPAAAKFAAIKILRGLLFHGVPLDAIKPVPILKGMLREGQGDHFGALWKSAMEEVIALLQTRQ